MAQIVLDVGSGRSLPNGKAAMDVVDAIKAIDTGKHEIIIKAQLFKSAPPNIPLDRFVFSYLYDYAKSKGYKCTSSVFDKESLDFLMQFDPCFVKIACRPDLYWLIGEVPRKVPVYASYHNKIADGYMGGIYWLFCVPKYPAKREEYWLERGQFVSDHSIGWAVYNHLKPEIIEKHFVLTRDPDNPDSGPFAVTPSELSQIL